jgi:DNA-directed RNA polymerase specialized sigma24 family protein
MDHDASETEWLRSTVERFTTPLTRYAASLTGDADRARDVVQDTFMRLCEQEPKHLNGCLAEWLFTVCRHRALDLCRKEKRMTALTEVALETAAASEATPSVTVNGTPIVLFSAGTDDLTDSILSQLNINAPATPPTRTDGK